MRSRKPLQLYWRLSSLPELAHLRESDRRELLHRHLPRGTWRSIISSMVGLGFVAAIVTTVTLSGLRRNGQPMVEPMGAVTLFLIAFTLVAAITYQFRILQIRSQLRRFLKDAFKGERLPMCIECGYDMHGTSQDHCPECGSACRVPK